MTTSSGADMSKTPMVNSSEPKARRACVSASATADGRADGRAGVAVLLVWAAMVLSVWGFAFVPAPTKSPEWVLQAQSACFGTLSNGLPAPHGWMLLILSPLALISMLWISHANEMRAAIPIFRRSKPLRLVLAVLLALTMWEAHWTGKRITYAVRLARATAFNPGAVKGEPLPADYPRLNTTAPPFALVNQNGEAIDQTVFRGKITLLTFAFAHCSVVCPTLIKQVVDAHSQLQAKLDSHELQAVVVSVDPWRDTPSSLPSLAKTWSIPEGSHLLSGTPQDVQRALTGFQVPISRDEQTGIVNHAAQVMLVDRRGRIAYSFLNPSTSWLMEAAGRLLNE